MAALFHSLFACCFGEKEKEAPPVPDERTLLLGRDPRNTGDEGNDGNSMRTGPNDELRDQEFNQRLAEIVSKGTAQMLSPVLVRGSAVYSPVLPTASSSQANLPAPPTSRQPALQSFATGSQQQQQQRESRHSSQSSRHSSYRQHHPSLGPHIEQGAQPSEDGVSALEGLAANQSLTSGVGNTSQTNILGYSTIGMGASATGRRFQIHRGRPPSRTKPTENGVGTAVQRTQINGLSSAGEAGDEAKHRSESSPARPPTSPPRIINNTNNEEGSAERSRQSPDLDEKRQVHFKLPPGDLILQYDD